MYFLKLICLTAFQWAKQAFYLPQTIALGLKDRRRQADRQGAEAERLDRIRNPSKYAGR